jgi:hypothetical protein
VSITIYLPREVVKEKYLLRGQMLVDDATSIQLSAVWALVFSSGKHIAADGPV